ncbi:helicase, partial [SAR11 cluster bacterium PRT-SC02]
MENIENKINLFESINSIKGVGSKISKYLNNKKIDKIKDLLLDFPYSQTDRSNLIETNELEMGKIATIRLKVLKYNFPRIKNLPNKIICEDAKGKIEIVYFNSKEPYLKKIYPLNSNVVVSGKVNYYKNKYQITNPEYVTKDENIHEIKRLIPKYALTEGLTEKKYRKIIENVLNAIPDLCEWHDDDLFKKLNLPSWKDSIISLHNPKIKKDLNSIYYKRLAFDEIFTNLLIHSYNREKIKKIKKKQKKIINYNLDFKSKIGFELTKNQKIIITEIHNDLMSEKKMFRILQGDVGSGKTIISFITALNVIKSGYQCALMAPTEILAKQHFNSFKKLFGYLNFNVKILTGKTKLIKGITKEDVYVTL